MPRIMPAREMDLRILLGCEMSGLVRDAFAARGWEAVSADILPTERSPRLTYKTTGPVKTVLDHSVEVKSVHYQGDVRDLFDPEHPLNESRYIDIQCEYRTDLWDLAILFPPCDHLSLAGAVWWKQKQADGRQQAAANFFMEMVNAPAPLVAVENPVGIMGRKCDPLYRVPDQVVEPFWFGDPLAKKTCLWLKNLPGLVPSNLVDPVGRVATGGGSWRVDKAAGRTGMNRVSEDARGRANRKRERNRTLPGFAQAMADQWGSYAELLARTEVLDA